MQFKHPTNTNIVSTIAMCAVSTFIVGSALADITYWIGPDGGAFGDPTNWSDGAPSAQTTAIFDLPGEIDVTFTRSAVANQLLIESGDVNFHSTGSLLWLNSVGVWTPSLIIAGDTGSIASLNIIGGDMVGGFAIVGDEAGAYGSLTLSDGAQLDLAGHTWIGFAGSGTMMIEDGSGMYSVAATIGAADGSFGKATITGGSQWEVAANARIAQFLGSEGEVTVEGDGSLWETHGNLDLAMKDKGTLTIASGAHVVVHGSTFVGALTGASAADERGVLRVVGEDSLLAVGGDLWIGQSVPSGIAWSWTGRLVLENGGRTEVDGSLFHTGWLGPININITASDNFSEHPAITVSDTSHPAGADITIELIQNFIPEIGDVFRIITLPTASLTLPLLPWPREWEIVETGDEVQLHVTFTVNADLTGDGSVGVADLLLLLANWGPCADPTPGHCVGDLNHDGVVGITDLLLLLANWG